MRTHTVLHTKKFQSPTKAKKKSNNSKKYIFQLKLSLSLRVVELPHKHHKNLFLIRYGFHLKKLFKSDKRRLKKTILIKVRKKLSQGSGNEEYLC